MDVHAVVERVWPGESPRLEVLRGGLTNHNYKVTRAGGDACVVRVAGRGTELLGIDRAVEHEASRLAAGCGVGPDVVGFVDGCLVTRFVGSEIVPFERMREPTRFAVSARCSRASTSPASSAGRSTPSASSRRTGRRRPRRLAPRRFGAAHAGGA